MIDFLLKSTISLIVFLGFYHLVLEREKMHQFNRFYLLISILISLVIPFVTFEFIKVIPVVENIKPENIYSISKSPEKIIFNENDIQVEETVNYIPYLIWSAYLLGTLFLFVRFGKNYLKLISKIKSNPKVKYKNTTLVLMEEKTLPHTFLNAIFVNSEDYKNRNIEEELFAHELVHVTQKHTLDVLLIEFLKVVFWFNPIFILYKKAIQLNHEFLADEEIVKTYDNVPFYQNLLLQKGSDNQTVYLASNLNYLVTKKRLIMMTKNTSQKLAVLKKIAVVPILAGLIYFFCIEVVAKEKITPTLKDKQRDRYYSNVRVIMKDESKKKVVIDKMYEELTLEEKRQFLDYIQEPIVERKVTNELYNKLVSNHDIAVKINDKFIKNTELANYKPSDFKHQTYTKMYRRADLGEFKNDYYYTLYTNAYFDKHLKNSHLKFGNDTIKILSANYKDAKSYIAYEIESPKKSKKLVVRNKQERKVEYVTYKTSDAEYYKGVRFLYYENAKFVKAKLVSGKLLLDKKYEDLTSEEIKKFTFIKYCRPGPLKRISPTIKEFEGFKNSKKYAIWIDGLNVSNSKLKDYKPSDFVHFSGSVILKNARTKTHPQPFQYWFYTHKYYKDNNMDKYLRRCPGDSIVMSSSRAKNSQKKK
ncbi:M56 family metallopeptidase [Flavobacterium facile]|uniref:M56 family metallopeptidase n=1 Tax=Flavobacterium facile TaxID=2893174 RepID=UPI002E799979|nr:M56 family metallopeptidase [Flavobacterium sp. T-12]